MARSRRNDFVAGLFIVLSLAALAMVLILAGKWDEFGRKYQVYYVKFPQAGGIRLGSQVLLGGQPRGQVVSIKWVPSQVCPASLPAGALPGDASAPAVSAASTAAATTTAAAAATDAGSAAATSAASAAEPSATSASATSAVEPPAPSASATSAVTTIATSSAEPVAATSASAVTAVATGPAAAAAITAAPAKPGKPPEGFYYIIGIEVPADLDLHRDTAITIERPPVGEGGWLNISCLGSGEVAGLTPEDAIGGIGSGSMMEELVKALGVDDEAKKSIGVAIVNLKDVTVDLRGNMPKVAEALAGVQDITATIKTRLPPIMDDIKLSSGKLATTTQTIDAMLAENRGKIKETVATAGTAMNQINDLASSAKKDLTATFENLNRTSNDIRGLVAANRLSLTDSMSNIRQTSEQLKAASIEIRRAPWRLLYKPDQREADSMNIFDAARNYANATADLKSAETTLSTYLELRKENVPVDQPLIEEMLNRVRASLGKYEEAEKALWKQWGDTSK